MTMQYTVVIKNTGLELTKVVNDYNGRIPQGGVSSAVDHNMLRDYCQSMIKHVTYKE